MCGRYRLSRRKQLVEEYFDAPSDADDWSPRYNIAPTQPVPVIRQHPKEPRRDMSMMRWGLIPSWSKDASDSAKMINARSETAHQLPAFRDALKLRRCLIPADGFYEWHKRGSSKQPFYFEVRDSELFAFAGLWDRWKDANGQWIHCIAAVCAGCYRVPAEHRRRFPSARRHDYRLRHSGTTQSFRRASTHVVRDEPCIAEVTTLGCFTLRALISDFEFDLGDFTAPAAKELRQTLSFCGSLRQALNASLWY
jgi:putative SOS response-associated peptidase YedK